MARVQAHSGALTYITAPRPISRVQTSMARQGSACCSGWQLGMKSMRYINQCPRFLTRMGTMLVADKFCYLQDISDCSLVDRRPGEVAAG